MDIDYVIITNNAVKTCICNGTTVQEIIKAMLPTRINKIIENILNINTR